MLVCDWPLLGEVAGAALGDEEEAGAVAGVTVLVGAAIVPRCLRRPGCSEDMIEKVELHRETIQ